MGQRTTGFPKAIQERTQPEKLAIFFACLLLIDFVLISLIFSWTDWIAILILSLLFIVPGYISNAGMVITGKNGTPDLRGRFIIGAHNEKSPMPGEKGEPW
jgi:hypothetical protein